MAKKELEEKVKELEETIIDMQVFVYYVNSKYKEMNDKDKKEYIEKLMACRNVFHKYCREIDSAIEKIS